MKEFAAAFGTVAELQEEAAIQFGEEGSSAIGRSVTCTGL